MNSQPVNPEERTRGKSGGDRDFRDSGLIVGSHLAESVIPSDDDGGG
jgi:hypothetical protein